MHKGKADTGLLGEPSQSYYRQRRLMRRDYAASLMSSTKWRKLFRAVQQLELDVPMCRVKWTDGDVVDEMRTPIEADLYPPRAFIDTRFTPIALCSIEWLEFPARMVTSGECRGPIGRVVTPDLDEVERALLAVARFPTERTADGLRVIGHVK